MKKLYKMVLFSVLVITGCENLIEGPEDVNLNSGINGLQATFSSIQNNIFTLSCATSSCHGGSQNPNLSEGQAYNNLVNKASIENPSMLRVKSGESTNSFLMKKLTGDGTTRMPLGGQLSQAKIDSIALWIDNGALND